MENIKHIKKQIQKAKVNQKKSREYNANLKTKSVLEKYKAIYQEGYWDGNLTAYEEMLEHTLNDEMHMLEVDAICQHYAQ